MMTLTSGPWGLGRKVQIRSDLNGTGRDAHVPESCGGFWSNHNRSMNRQQLEAELFFLKLVISYDKTR